MADRDKTLFLGAGFPKWASNLPLVKDLFDFDIYIRGPREEERLDRIRKLKSYWDYHNPSEYNSLPMLMNFLEKKILKYCFGT